MWECDEALESDPNGASRRANRQRGGPLGDSKSRVKFATLFATLASIDRFDR